MGRLPNKLVPKNIKDINLINKDYSNVIDDLDNGLFLDSGSDSDSESEYNFNEKKNYNLDEKKLI